MDTPTNNCQRHPGTPMYRDHHGRNSWKCKRCNVENVTSWRQRQKKRLVEEAGGRCACCGYNRCLQALEFHHINPATKSFGLAKAGLTRSIAQAREEAKKCVLVCANCHREIEAGLRACPVGIEPTTIA